MIFSLLKLSIDDIKMLISSTFYTFHLILTMDIIEKTVKSFY